MTQALLSRRWYHLAASSVALLVIVPISSAPAQAPPPTAAQVQAERERLETEKLREEIRELRISNDQAQSQRDQLLAWAPFITVLLAVFGVVVPVIREVRQQRVQREKEAEQRRIDEERRREQHEAELEQRRLEELRRFDELFSQAVANLGAQETSVKVSAAIALGSFLRPEYASARAQIHAVVCANLATDHEPLVNRFLVRAFEVSLPLELEARKAEASPQPLDLARCQMPRADLRGLDFQERADLGFAELKRADLRDAILLRVEGYEVVLDGAHLTGAVLREGRLHGASCVGARFHSADLMAAQFKRTPKRRADLKRAEFFGAKLQGAHFEESDLTGALFDDANVTETFFHGAIFADRTLLSLLETKIVKGAPSWTKAYFDEPVKKRLAELAGN